MIKILSPDRAVREMADTQVNNLEQFIVGHVAESLKAC
jgi:hypothetical protein